MELIYLEKTLEEPIIVELDMQKIAKSGFIWTIVLSILFIVINILIHKQVEIKISFWSVLLFIVGFVFLIILHEAFHLLGFIVFGKAKWTEIDYGVNLKLGVAYATTTKPLFNKDMKKALMLPFWTTGVLPTIIGFIIGSNLLVFLGAWLIAGAIGDIYMYKELIKYPKDALVKDDPEMPILYVYVNK